MSTVVLISHTAPPQANAGAGRLAGLVRHLPDRGWRPVVVTSAFAGQGAVAGAPTARPSEPLVAYQRRFGEAGDPSGAAGPERGRLKGVVLDRLAVPDLHAGWVPGAALAAVRAARRHGAQALYSSSPSEASHLAALVASRVTGLPWVAELRDGWLVDGLKELDRHPLRRAVEGWLERAVARRADTLAAVTRPIADDLRVRYGAAEWVPNGFDHVEPSAGNRAEAAAMLDPEAFNFVYTGMFSHSRLTRSPAVLAEAFRRMATSENGERPVALTVLGRLTPAERDVLEAVPRVTLVEHRPRAVAMALQRQADALVVVTHPGERTVATGKLFEYLGASRPVLALAQDNEAARLVTELGVGVVADPADAERVAAAALEITRGGVSGRDPAGPELRPFTRAGIAARVAGLLDEVVAAKRTA